MRTPKPLLPVALPSRKRLLIGAGLLSLLMLSAFAFGRGDGAKTAGTAEPVSKALEGPSPADLFATFGLTAALLGAALFFLPKLLRKSRLAPRRERALELVDALALGPKRQVFVVSFKDRYLLLGAGQEEMSLLADYAREDFEPEPLGEPLAAAQEVVSKDSPLRSQPVTLRPEAKVREPPMSELNPWDEVLVAMPPTPHGRPELAPEPGEATPRHPRPMSAPPRGRLPAAFQRLVEQSASGDRNS